MAAYEALTTDLCVVKAQIHAGGRGKGGGVKLVRSAAEDREAADAILGKQLVTHQTGPAGQLVRRLWVEEGSDIESEYYIGIAIDREEERPVMMASSEGGMEIEEVAANQPEKILRAAFTADGGSTFRGVTYVQSTAPSLSSLNGKALVYDWDVDASGNATWEIWEWN